MALDIASIFVGVAATSIAGMIGYFGKRRFSREPEKDEASITLSYIDIAAKLKTNGLLLEEVDNIRDLMTTRKRKQEVLAEPAPTAMSPYWTQSAMNVRASGAAEVADAQLKAVLCEMDLLLGDDERGASEEAQAAWVSFRDQQASFAAAAFEGGTNAPLIFSTEYEALTLQRVANLKSIIDERRRQQASG